MFIPFLKKYVYPKCQCQMAIFKKEQEDLERANRRTSLDRIYRHNIMNDDLKKASFDNFIARPGTETIFKTTLDYANNFANKNKGLLGFGDPGNGKSHLFAAIHHVLDRKGYVSLFIDCTQLFNIAEEARKSRSQVSINSIVQAAIECDLLTLDEIGTGKMTQDDYDTLFPIINGRQGKKTNYTTNLNLDELTVWLSTDKYGKTMDNKGRVVDRIIGSCDIVENKGTSKRKEDTMNRIQALNGRRMTDD